MRLRRGRKILISGGGRANFTNLHTGPQHFLSENPHFAKSALARYSPGEFVSLVERYGIAYHAKAPGQLFCDGSARQIVEMLLAEAAEVELRLQTSVESVRRDGEGFSLVLRSAAAVEQVSVKQLVVATGGLSIPKLGATDFGYRLARQFGLRVVEPRPALVPFTFGSADVARFEGLSGVACEAELSLVPAVQGRRGQPVRFRDRLLITHRGLSGPAVLQASSYWRPGMSLAIDFAPGRQVGEALLKPGARKDESSARGAWTEHLPKRLAERLFALAPPDGWRNEALLAAEDRLHRWSLEPGGTEGYAKAEVTAGGVSTADLDAQTMEARRVPGLFFIGEVVDVTGWLGGFNFQWAWASAAAVAAAIRA